MEVGETSVVEHRPWFCNWDLLFLQLDTSRCEYNMTKLWYLFDTSNHQYIDLIVNLKDEAVRAKTNG